VAADKSHTYVDLARFAGTVAAIARTLESPLDPESRIHHMLDLVRQLVPCDRCALFTRPGHPPSALTVVPNVPRAEREDLTEFLQGVLHFMDGDDTRSRTIEARAHLALPVIGLDEILGVLLVDRDRGDGYEPHHLRLLAAVCSQLGGYLTMVRLHHETTQQTAQLVNREQQLRGSARFREEFIGVIGHDLRNPLSAIRTGAHLLMKRAPLDAPDIALVQRIVGSADRMSRMIDELMDFARGRLGGGFPLRRTYVDLHALCEDVVEEAQTAHGRRIHLELSGAPRGFWDSDRLAQVVSNLVGNAVQHSRPEDRVRVSARHDRDEAIIAVTNAGPPIPAEQLDGIFEPFRRGERARAVGLGLGLYIVERIVDAHGGRITATSAAAEGTTFEVRLPCRRASDREGIERRDGRPERV
jgi:signal transduction histidine kinase